MISNFTQNIFGPRKNWASKVETFREKYFEIDKKFRKCLIKKFMSIKQYILSQFEDNNILSSSVFNQC